MYKYGYVKQDVKDATVHPLFATWRMMNVRCYDPRHKSYHRYGGRGITVCENWYWGKEDGFATFVKDMPKKPEGYTLDRIDNDKGYSKYNCRWSSKKHQQNNLSVGSKNSSGYIGVVRRNNTWVAHLMLNNKNVILGSFRHKTDAYDLYITVKNIKIQKGDLDALKYVESLKQRINGKRSYTGKTSKYYGVRLHRDGVRYSAATHYKDIEGKLKQKYLGLYENEEDAAQAVIDFVEGGRCCDD